MNGRINGLTLIEVIIVIAILGIIVAITIPKFIIYNSFAIESVCLANCKIVERQYDVFLIQGHQDVGFDQFFHDNFKRVCPMGGIIIYEDGKVMCSLHGYTGEDKDDGGEDEVPWL